MIFPWQKEQWQKLVNLKNENRLPHALLLSGMSGTGKASFADHLSRLLLCQQNKADEACLCHPCRLIAGRAHPNVLWIEPEKTGQAIKVDQVRYVSEFVNQSSFQDGYRIVLIHPADAMNVNAANALLKTLEEPAPNAILVLVADQHARLPATVLSRCQRITFPQPKKAEALGWLMQELKDKTIEPELLLNLANGAPFAALKLVEEEALTCRQTLFQTLYALSQKQGDPIVCAAQGKDSELIPWLNFFLSWLKDLSWLQLTEDETVLTNQDYLKELTELKQKTQLTNNIKLMEYAQKLRGQISVGINLNKQLVMESLFIRWVEGK